MPATNNAALKIVDIEEFKSLVGINGTNHDAKLALLGRAAEDFVEAETGQDLGGNQWDELYTGDGTDALILNHFPLSALTTVEIINDPPPHDILVLTGSDRQIRADKGGQLIRIDGGIWPERPPESIHVVYTSKKPGRDLVMALYDMMEHRWRTAKLIGMKSETIGNYSYTVAAYKDIPGLKPVIERYKDPSRKFK